MNIARPIRRMMSVANVYLQQLESNWLQKACTRMALGTGRISTHHTMCHFMSKFHNSQSRQMVFSLLMNYYYYHYCSSHCSVFSGPLTLRHICIHFILCEEPIELSRVVGIYIHSYSGMQTYLKNLFDIYFYYYYYYRRDIKSKWGSILSMTIYARHAFRDILVHEHEPNTLQSILEFGR